MIVHLNKSVSKEQAEQLAEKYQSILFENGKLVLVTPSKVKAADEELKKVADEVFVSDTDIQLASKQYIATKRKVDLGGVTVGGDTNNTVVITGPCSVESEEQIESAAQLCVELGVKVLRAGAYKPRTSPYTFQGLGLEGLKLLDKMRSKYGLKIITEVRDSTHVDEVIEYADIIQIGAKSMYDHGILRKCGKSRKPVLLKRGFGTTLQEFVQSAEFILSGGNANVMLCERGIRTFETKTRFTLDLCGAAWLKQYTNLPLVLDPSHAIGYAYGVPDLARACVAMGIDGLLIESHPNPKVAKSDADQQLNFEEFRNLYASLKTVAGAVGYKVV
ncbi:MAG TPA: bifunctional 3-deoxy-7-phosphoheptulonate synthase/chorismate mutase [Chitinophagales bacterium]|nr:bifunctional 3-deoxy-7-phosphoheptulonate synthase/chorismate mutase [Chitinophagales bacterium]